METKSKAYSRSEASTGWTLIDIHRVYYRERNFGRSLEDMDIKSKIANLRRALWPNENNKQTQSRTRL